MKCRPGVQSSLLGGILALAAASRRLRCEHVTLIEPCAGRACAANLSGRGRLLQDLCPNPVPARAEPVRRPMQEALLFMHAPKVGGSTVTSMVESAWNGTRRWHCLTDTSGSILFFSYGPAMPAPFPKSETGILSQQWEPGQADKVASLCSWISTHDADWSLLELWGFMPRQAVMQLRHPVARALSKIHHDLRTVVTHLMDSKTAEHGMDAGQCSGYYYYC